MKPRTWLIIGLGLALMFMTYNQKKEGIWTSATTYEEAGLSGEAYDAAYEGYLVNDVTATAGLAGKSEESKDKKGSVVWPLFVVGGIILALFISGWSLLQNTGFIFISAGILVLALLMR